MHFHSWFGIRVVQEEESLRWHGFPENDFIVRIAALQNEWAASPIGDCNVDLCLFDLVRQSSQFTIWLMVRQSCWHVCPSTIYSKCSPVESICFALWNMIYSRLYIDSRLIFEIIFNSKDRTSSLLACIMDKTKPLDAGWLYRLELACWPPYGVPSESPRRAIYLCRQTKVINNGVVMNSPIDKRLSLHSVQSLSQTLAPHESESIWMKKNGIYHRTIDGIAGAGWIAENHLAVLCFATAKR